MPITAVTPIQRESLGFSNLTISSLTMTTYATNGMPLTPSQLGVGATADWVQVQSSGGYTFVYDYANAKLLAYWGGGSGAVMTEVTNATSLALSGIRVMALGS